MTILLEVGWPANGPVGRKCWNAGAGFQAEHSAANFQRALGDQLFQDATLKNVRIVEADLEEARRRAAR
jgi:hypothetical protein